jgi:hypothetical protein
MAGDWRHCEYCRALCFACRGDLLLRFGRKSPAFYILRLSHAFHRPFISFCSVINH